MIYLDHAATTPIYPEVKEAMLPFLGEHYGNPSSMHGIGRRARQGVDQARDQVAGALHGSPGELIFTSGGTEADNLALLGMASTLREQGKTHFITSQVEHHAVLGPCSYLEKLGFQVTYLSVDQTGQVSIEELQEVITGKTGLISIIYGNNEVGTIQPIQEIGRIARERGIYFHTDAVQVFGVLPIDVCSLSVDLLTISGHKFGAPKGVGALYVARHVPLKSHLFGGKQEWNRRGGTENVAGIVGMGKAAEIVSEKMESFQRNVLACREAMIKVWEKASLDFVINGHQEKFLPHILNVSFPGLETETLLMNLDLEGVACSSGSACTSGTLEISHVLKAMQLPEPVLRSAVRFSFGWNTSVEDAAEAAKRLVNIVKRLQER